MKFDMERLVQEQRKALEIKQAREAENFKQQRSLQEICKEINSGENGIRLSEAFFINEDVRHVMKEYVATMIQAGVEERTTIQTHIKNVFGFSKAIYVAGWPIGHHPYEHRGFSESTGVDEILITRSLRIVNYTSPELSPSNFPRAEGVYINTYFQPEIMVQSMAMNAASNKAAWVSLPR